MKQSLHVKFNVYYRPFRYIKAGEHSRMIMEGTEKLVKIQKFITHPQAYDMRMEKKYGSWLGDLLDFDFSLLLLDSTVKFTDSIRPVCLPTSDNQDYSSQETYASGWGFTKAMRGMTRHEIIYTAPSDVPKIAKLKVVINDRCEEKYDLCGFCAKPTMLCTYGNPYNKSVIVDACQGDSGGRII